MHEEDIRIGTVAGFPVSIHWSTLVILWLFTWSLATTLPHASPGYSTSTYWLAGLIGAVVLLASLMAHELTHAVVARRQGVEVDSVTLWLFGGVARLRGEAKTAKSEFKIAASGPAVSLALAAVFAATAVVLRHFGVESIVVAVAWWLAVINLILALFNMLPAAPLDGGRVLRAILWRRTGDRVQAAVTAARCGRVLGYVVIGLGLLEFLAGSLIGGAWMAFIGWFLLTAAHHEETQVVARQSLAGVTVAQAMTPNPQTAPDWITAEEFIQRYLLGDRHSAYPVEGPGGSITGLITLAQLRRLAPHQRSTTLVRDVAIPLSEVPTASPHEALTALMERLTPDRSRALVVENGRVVGIVTASDITQLIDVRALAQAPVSRR
jgi:Zn-dependent protease/CBS domain-containing protein